jgi:hypothetical protein
MTTETPLTRRQLLRWSRAGVLACAGLAGLVPACDWDGNFTILGYTTAPNYDCKYKTVRVPIFENRTLRRGLEFDLTNQVITDIQQFTPLKIRTAGQDADLELTGTIVQVQKNILNLNQLGEVREGEMNFVVEVVLRDVHTGEILSRPGRRPTDPSPFEPMVPPSIGNVPGMRETPIVSAPTQPTTPDIAVPPPSGESLALGQPRPLEPPPPPGPPLKIGATAIFIPELGQSTTSAYDRAIKNVAIQIVSMMEKPW